MKVTRDVVLDLLPLYLAGEASADTRALVREFLAQDLELAQRLHTPAADLLPGATTLPPDLELRSLRRARALIALQKWLFGPAILFTALALSFKVTFEHGHLEQAHFLILDYPLPVGALAALAVLFWGAYHWARRRLRSLN